MTKALTLDQPYATLVEREIKTIETRSWPTKHRGRLLIHASKKKPIFGRLGNTLTYDDSDPKVSTPKGDWLLPLGAIVASCTLVDVVPMVNYNAPTPRHGPLDNLDVPACIDVKPDALTYWWHHDGGFRDVTNQRPYGDFTPGRFAWILDDIKSTTERCPACWGEGGRGWIGDVHSGAPYEPCAYCWPRDADGEFVMGMASHEYDQRRGAFGCDPIPARGRQRLWEWPSTVVTPETPHGGMWIMGERRAPGDYREPGDNSW
jgi:activating signal cointegrator 1